MKKTKKLTVIAPIEDTPAYAAGFQDTILKIDSKTEEGMLTPQWL